MKLKDKVALITGSSQGIGAGIAERFAKEGADVVINYVGGEDRAAEMVKTIRGLGRKAIDVQADVSNVTEVNAMFDKAFSEMGTVDILVNNAGIEIRAPMWEVTEKDWDRVVDINLKGSFFCTQALVQRLMKSKSPGRVINISSVHEELPFPHFSAYCASKGGVKMLMRNLMVELAPLGITINNIAPGAIETPINKDLLNDPKELKALLANIPLNRLGQTSDVAGAAVFLASDDASYVTGTTVTVDGGLIWSYSEQ